ncbi:MAG: metallophosphoesterase [Pseudomonadales bacterium]|nr:metallophosphoesterase [Pseudomonadales bacterium]
MSLKREDIDPQLLGRLEPRISWYHLTQRLLREHDKGDHFTKRELDDLLPLGAAIRVLATLTGIRRRGERNARALSVTHHTCRSAKLPQAFDGYRILQLSDLHFDGPLDYLPGLSDCLEGLRYDLCVITGDFRHRFQDSKRLRDQFAALRPVIDAEIFAVPGNHDALGMVVWLEEMGYNFLLNESCAIRRADASIRVAGVDDYHYFRCADIEKAMAGIEDEFVVMLNHSPEQFREAAYAGVDLYLSGHTHGGQVCGPGGWAPRLNLECSRRVGQGAWRFRDMTGYTSRGVGTSLAHLRFNCAPEVVVHELRRESPGDEFQRHDAE